MDEEELQSVYAWVDEVPLSRPKKNIARDFCDGVLVAEVVKHHIPKMVELHNYSAANSMDRKMYNWNTLNQRVFKKIGLKVPKKDFEDISNAKTGCIETFLRNLMEKIEAYKEGHGYEHTPSAAPASGKPEKRAGRQAHPSDHEYDARRAAYESNHPPSVKELQQEMKKLGYDDEGEYDEGEGDELQHEIDTSILVEKEQTIQELRETVEILETKVRKLEQLVRLKDTKIHTLQQKLQTSQH
mmetsp:Transcript_37694/g.97247  ORF Transcript_37694/g.97247 Transcript_37694/m.97247 type:complete len:242 (-) Transcript_37694:78-803(-)